MQEFVWLLTEAVKKSSKDYIILAHDDMYFCPNWDEVLGKN